MIKAEHAFAVYCDGHYLCNKHAILALSRESAAELAENLGWKQVTDFEWLCPVCLSKREQERK
jgi:hypothetical protein